MAWDDSDVQRCGGWQLPLGETLADEVEYLPANPYRTVVRAKRRFGCGQEKARVRR